MATRELASRASRSSSKKDGEAPKARYSDNRTLPTIEIEDLASSTETTNILIHGDSGTMKTTLAGQAPRSLFISTEKGVVSAQRTGSTAKVVRAYDWDRVEASLRYVDEHPGMFDWIIIDSATKMQVLLMRWLLGMIHEENEVRDLDIPAIQDHQKWQNMYKRFWDRIIDMPVNTILITTSMLREDAEGESLVLPALTGKDYEIAAYCMAQVDVGLYCSVERSDSRNAPTKRTILTETQPPYWAKDRYRALPREIKVKEDDFGVMKRIIKAINESAKNAPKPARERNAEEES